MADPKVQRIQQNLIPQDPGLKDLLDLLKKQILLTTNCHHIGTVQSFDAENQTATATINYRRTYFNLNKSTGNYDPVLKEYPTLIDCPVIFLGGGNAALTFPVSKGDECLVLFNDRDIDNWFQGGGSGALATPRLHSFSDGLILVGLRSLAHSIDDFDTTRAVLRNGDALVGVGDTLVKIANNSTTLNTLLQTLVTDIRNLVAATAAITVTGVTSGGGISGPPVNAAAITAVGSSLSALATQIGGLLE